MRSLSFIALTLVACSPGPERLEAEQYAVAVDPLLVENSILSDQVLDLAADVYNGDATPEQTRSRWAEVVVPVSAHIYDQASLVQPPPTWDTWHTDLVEIWGARADAYRELSDAQILADQQLWTAARRKADKAKLDEEQWFTEVNQEFKRFDFTLDQFP